MSAKQESKSAVWWRHEEGRRTRLVSPEGVPLDFGVAAAGDRLTAFLIDAGIIAASLLVLLLASLPLYEESIHAVLILASFLVVNFYFLWFEHRWQGRTPGKRVRSLRVVDAHGGRLTVEAVIVRNLTRYVEIVIPLLLLTAPETLWPDAPPWLAGVNCLWLLAFGFMPLFNRQRRRVGDLIAGTLVIRTPAPALLRDLADAAPDQAKGADTAAAAGAADADDATAPRFGFTEPQLGHYGIYELQVLEEILRNPHPYGADAAIAQVREKIAAKIGWDGEVDDDLAFLRAFYTAQRAHLERHMVLGRRREDKHDGAAPPAPPPESVED